MNALWRAAAAFVAIKALSLGRLSASRVAEPEPIPFVVHVMTETTVERVR